MKERWAISGRLHRMEGRNKQNSWWKQDNTKEKQQKKVDQDTDSSQKGAEKESKTIRYETEVQLGG